MRTVAQNVPAGPIERRSAEGLVRTIYRKLSRAWGRQHWWPAETPFEVIAGAILTQNTSWTNVERALAKLRERGVLSLEGIRETPLNELEELVRSSGYFRQKARRLKDLVAFVDSKYARSLEQMFASPTEVLREQLLAQKGIGPETADSILLYAGLHPIFVVDAYTRRVLERHGAILPSTRYDEIRALVERGLRQEKPVPASHKGARERPTAHPPSPMSSAQQKELTQVYNEMHGLFVQLGKHYCQKRKPQCNVCPLGELLTREEKAALLG